MKYKFLSAIGILAIAATVGACTSSKLEYSKVKVPASQIESNLDVFGITPGSNKLVLVNNNKGIGGTWDYNAGITTHTRDTVIVPFLGEQIIKFYATCDTEIVLVEKKVNVTKIDFPSDPLWISLAGEGLEGKTWVWNTDLTQTGCYGAGGYGWSPVYPDWGSTSSGKGEWSPVEVYPDEYIVIDLNGSANITLHKHDGSVEKGSFSCSSDISSDKAEIGWAGTVTFRGASVPSAYSYYEGSPAGTTFEIAKLTDDELVLVQADPEQAGVFCDPNWASASTHWCFKKK